MKKSAILGVLALCGAAFYAVPLSAETIVLQPGSEGKDTYVCDCLPKVNNPNGPVTNLYQGQYGNCFDRLLIRWDLSSLPQNVSITSAIMELKAGSLTGSLSGQMVYYRITDDWKETGVTFATLPGYTPEDSVITNWPTSGQWHAVDITQFVQKWYADTASNHGIYGHSVRTTKQCTQQFSSSDVSTAANRPKLTITYTPASGVQRPADPLPSRFELGQNYPNPFNPATNIRYSIPGNEPVSLKVFDVKGKEVAVLVDRMQAPGSYEIIFDGKSLAGGIYFYRLQAGSLRDVKKLIFMK
jgi:hypothetical protein